MHRKEWWVAGLALAIAAVGLVSCGGSSEDEATPLQLTEVRLEKAEPNRLVITWTTSVPTEGEVRYSTDRLTLGEAVPVRSMTTIHLTAIEGLAPSRTYFYQVVARSARGEEIVSSVYEASTPGSAGDVSTAIAPSGSYEVAVVTTRFGEIVIRFHEDEAPRHTDNFKKLAREHFFDGTLFHRVIPTFVIQGGDPLSKDDDRSNDGTGGPGYTLPAEIRYGHRRGSVASARTPDEVNPERRSSGSQFYICVAPIPQLDGKYTVFGEVVRGMNVVDAIVSVPTDNSDNPLTAIPMEVTIRRVESDEAP